MVRTEPQAAGLQRALNELGRKLDVVLTFDVPDEELVKRLSGRTVCENCQTPYTGREPGTTCDKCGGPVRKLLSSPAIQFKGSGWYITDYARAGKSESSTKDGGSSPGDAKTDTKPDAKSDTKSESKPETKSESKSDSKPAAPSTS